MQHWGWSIWIGVQFPHEILLLSSIPSNFPLASISRCKISTLFLKLLTIFFTCKSMQLPSKLNWEQQQPSTKQPSSRKKTKKTTFLLRKWKDPKKNQLIIFTGYHHMSSLDWKESPSHQGYHWKSFKKNPDTKVSLVHPEVRSILIVLEHLNWMLHFLGRNPYIYMVF